MGRPAKQTHEKIPEHQQSAVPEAVHEVQKKERIGCGSLENIERILRKVRTYEIEGYLPGGAHTAPDPEQNPDIPADRTCYVKDNKDQRY
jgi:hypothetical protein